MIFETNLHNTLKTNKTQGDKMSYYIKKNNSIFDSIFDNFYYQPETSRKNCNIFQDEDSTTIEIEASGLSKKDITIDVIENVLHICHKPENKKCKKYIKQEIFDDPFKNKYKLESNMDAKNISAKMQDGILTVNIPKLKDKTSSRIKIT